jgi:hypothetical protein
VSGRFVRGSGRTVRRGGAGGEFERSPTHRLVVVVGREFGRLGTVWSRVRSPAPPALRRRRLGQQRTSPSVECSGNTHLPWRGRVLSSLPCPTHAPPPLVSNNAHPPPFHVPLLLRRRTSPPLHVPLVSDNARPPPFRGRSGTWRRRRGCWSPPSRARRGRCAQRTSSPPRAPTPPPSPPGPSPPLSLRFCPFPAPLARSLPSPAAASCLLRPEGGSGGNGVR